MAGWLEWCRVRGQNRKVDMEERDGGRYLQDRRERKEGGKYQKGKEGEWIEDGGRKGQGRTDEGRGKEIWEMGKRTKKRKRR